MTDHTHDEIRAQFEAERLALEPLAAVLRDEIKRLTIIGGANEYDLARAVVDAGYTLTAEPKPKPDLRAALDTLARHLGC